MEIGIIGLGYVGLIKCIGLSALGNTVYGFDLTTLIDSLFNNNHASGNYEHGVRANNSNNNVISHNYFGNNGLSEDNTYSNVYLEADNSYNNIQSNTGRSSVSPDNRPKYSVDVVDATSVKNVICNNDLTDTVNAYGTGVLHNSGTGTVTTSANRVS